MDCFDKPIELMKREEIFKAIEDLKGVQRALEAYYVKIEHRISKLNDQRYLHKVIEDLQNPKSEIGD